MLYQVLALVLEPRFSDIGKFLVLCDSIMTALFFPKPVLHTPCSVNYDFASRPRKLCNKAEVRYSVLVSLSSSSCADLLQEHSGLVSQLCKRTRKESARPKTPENFPDSNPGPLMTKRNRLRRGGNVYYDFLPCEWVMSVIVLTLCQESIVLWGPSAPCHDRVQQILRIALH